MLKTQVTKLGFYRYARPSWEHAVIVEVTGIDGNERNLGVHFKKGTYYLPMEEIPADAIFYYLGTEIEEN
jgi:hypothetical protein